MALTPGTTLGPYEVLSAIGAGGMGEVYKARDTKLDRDVALKILPDAFVNDPERLARFQREAKVLASLNHPNIAQIHGLEESGDSPALVLEYVEGPTLQDRIAKGPIPLDEALPIARQIAEALEAAHEQGIIHRDLKPANVKVKTDGTVKVLDFGLAKALQPELSDLDAANSPTMTMTAAATKMGVIMGTAAYMSPEQASGKTVDKRDIWAFGVVLFEMLTGQGLFTGKTVSDTLALVLTKEPDWASLPSTTPAALQRLLHRCLKKEPKQRLGYIGDARLDIDDARAAPGSETTEAAPIAQPALWQRPLPALLVLAAVVGISGLVGWSLTSPSESVPVVRMSIPLGVNERFVGQTFSLTAISPDGSRIVYPTEEGLLLRPVSELQATPIAGTGRGGSGRRAFNPFFSPDGEWVAYYQQGGQLRKVAVSGGAPVTLCEIDQPYGASWGTDDTILYGQGPDGIWQVPGTGGTPEQVIAVEDGTEAYGPQMLPGGEAVLYTLGTGPGQWEDAQIVVEHVATGERTVLIDGGRDGRYLPTGHLVYVLNGVLFAVPFDPKARAVTGGPVSLVEGIRNAAGGRGAAQFSVADSGALVYVPGSGGGDYSLAWVSRTGEEAPTLAPLRNYADVRVSPDGSRLAVEIRGDGNTDVWIWHLEQGPLTRLTFDEAVDDVPLWTPDSSRVVFRSSRDGGGLFWKAADGSGEVERLWESADQPRPFGWSSEGRIVFDQEPGDIGVLTHDGDSTVEMLLETEFREIVFALSPDGRWIAYQSDESGAVEIYVRPFPEVDDGRWQVSTSGGFDPVWSPDGRELYFSSFGRMMVASVEPGETFSAGSPVELFRNYVTADAIRGFDVAPDGERFLMRIDQRAEITEGRQGLIFVLNWFSELQARVPTGR